MRVPPARAPVAMLLIQILVLAGCGDDGSGAGDADAGDAAAGTDADVGAPDAGPLVPEPLPTALPMLTPCPPGWSEVSGAAGEPATCHPYDGDPPECAADDAPFPGEGCAPIAAPCPADGWPAAVPSGAPVVYVREGAIAGDGSRAAPFGTITEALPAPGSGTALVVAIAVGRYAESVELRGVEVSLVGACLETVIDGAVVIEGGAGALENLQVNDSLDAITVLDSAVALDGVLIAPRAGERLSAGLTTADATVNARSLVIRGPADRGISVLRRSNVTVRRSVMEGLAADAINSGTSDVLVEDAAFLRFARATEWRGVFFVHAGGTMALRRVAVLGGYGSPLSILDEVRAELRDVVFEGPPVIEDGPLGAVVVIGPAALDLERVTLRRLRGGSLVVAVGGRVDARDLVIVDSLAAATEDYGQGIEVAAEGIADLERVLVRNARVNGVLVDGAGTSVVARDLTVLDTTADAMGTFGRAIQIQRGATAMLERATLRGNHEVSIAVARRGSSLTATDLRVEGTRARLCAEQGGTCAAAGIGVGVYEESTATIEGFYIGHNVLAGVQIARMGALDLRSGVIEGNPVGANVQVPSYDLMRLTDEVFYRGNDVNLDSEELPVPDPEVPAR